MSSAPKETRSIAILAHVDAGKTTVSERLLYFSETIPGLGEVDEGLATMDYLEEEKKRGITIEAGIASYSMEGHARHLRGYARPRGFRRGGGFRPAGRGRRHPGAFRRERNRIARAWKRGRKSRRTATGPLIFINKLDIAGSRLPQGDGADPGDVRREARGAYLARVRAGAAGGQPALDGVIDVLNQLALYRSVENPRKLIKGDVPGFPRRRLRRARART